MVLRRKIFWETRIDPNIRVTGDCGSAPQTVVDEAIKLFSELPEFDSVFCVIDRDQHARFDQALQRIRDKELEKVDGKPARFEAVSSIPCFEFWILLHYEFTTAPMPRYDDIRERMTQIPDLAGYEKGSRGLFALTKMKLNVAIKNARRANKAAAANGTDNPTTDMPNLIEYLTNMASSGR